MTRGNCESPHDLPHVTCHVDAFELLLLNAINYIIIVGSISKYDISIAIVSLVVSV